MKACKLHMLFALNNFYELIFAFYACQNNFYSWFYQHQL